MKAVCSKDNLLGEFGGEEKVVEGGDGGKLGREVGGQGGAHEQVVVRAVRAYAYI